MLKKKTMAAALCAALSAAGAAKAAAPPAYDVQITYGVTLLGFTVGSMQVNLKLHDGLYEAEAYVRPEGLAATFAPNTVDATANGSGSVGVMEPNSSWVRQTSPKKIQTVTIQFKPGEAPVAVSDPAYTVEEWSPTAEQMKGTVDPLGAIVAMMFIPTAGPGDKACGDSVPVYDGKRAYAFDMWSDGQSQMKRGGGGYNGPALHCVASYRRIAGWDAERMKKGTSTKIEMYFAPIGKGANGGPAFYMPVRMSSDVDVGEVVAVPTKVTINGKDWAQFFAEGG